jgi:hypothetical protein
MLRRVALVRTEVSEELSASFIRVTRIGVLGTTLAVTSNRPTLRINSIGAFACRDRIIRYQSLGMIMSACVEVRTEYFTNANPKRVPMYELAVANHVIGRKWLMPLCAPCSNVGTSHRRRKSIWCNMGNELKRAIGPEEPPVVSIWLQPDDVLGLWGGGWCVGGVWLADSYKRPLVGPLRCTNWDSGRFGPLSQVLKPPSCRRCGGRLF